MRTPRRYDPSELSALEPEQFSAAALRPLPRAKLSRGLTLLLLALRIYVLIAVPVVIWAFARALIFGS
jgi:hypothetical protein